MKKMMMVLFPVLVSTSIIAQEYSYTCYSYFWNGYENEKGTMELTVNGNIAQADINEVSWDEDLGGKLDPNYRSQGHIKFLKFGTELLLQGDLLSGGNLLKDGSLGGIARVEGEAEGGFYQYKFICKR